MSLRQFFVGQVLLVGLVWALGWIPSPIEAAHAEDTALQLRVQRLEALAKANADYLGSWGRILDGQDRQVAARQIQYANFTDAMVKADSNLQKLWNQYGGPVSAQAVTNTMRWNYPNRRGQEKAWEQARSAVR